MLICQKAELLRIPLGTLQEAGQLIIDTTYLLPLVGIEIESNLLALMNENKFDLQLEEMSISLISVFEVQAKCARLKIPEKVVLEGMDAILHGFSVESFYEGRVVREAQRLREKFNEYIDCVIIATASTRKEHLLTEDSRILNEAQWIRQTCGVEVMDFRHLQGGAD